MSITALIDSLFSIILEKSTIFKFFLFDIFFMFDYRETRQTAEKIRAQNQENMRKESANIKVTKETKSSPPGRGRGGKMRGGSRPSRQRKMPKKLADKDVITEGQDDLDEEEGDEQADDDSDSGSWVSEDDPDKLWCICQQPHSNKFMICCDSCLDWFHGKCVGITKQQGKEMEEAGQDWKCPQCLEGKKKPTEAEDSIDTKAEEADTPEPDDKVPEEAVDEEFVPSQTKPKTSERGKLRRKSSTGGGGESAEKKRKTATCHMCNSEPRDNSIYCSDTCIAAHAASALAMLTKDGKTFKVWRLSLKYH